MIEGGVRRMGEGKMGDGRERGEREANLARLSRFTQCFERERRGGRERRG